MCLLTDLNLEASVVRLDLGLPTSTIFMYSGQPFVFSMRQQIAYMLSALYAIACPSVYMSVCHMGGSHKNG